MPAITVRDGKHETKYGAGQHVHDGRMDCLEVGEHYEAVIHERPNIGGGARTPAFQAGRYPNPHVSYGWMDKHERHMIEVRPTAINKNELLLLMNWKKGHGGRDLVQQQFLPPGEWETDAGHFPNDLFDEVVVPPSGSAAFYDDRNKGGRHVRLGPGRHRLDDYNLQDRVSSIVFELDEWEEINLEVGKPEALTKIGETKIQNVDIKVPAGRSKVTAKIHTKRIRSITTSWETNSRITTHTNIKASVFKIVDIESQIETQFEARASGSEFNSDETDFGIEVEVQPDENDRVKGTILVDVLKGTVPLTKTLRNVRSGEIIKIHGETTGEILESKGNFVD